VLLLTVAMHNIIVLYHVTFGVACERELSITPTRPEGKGDLIGSQVVPVLQAVDAGNHKFMALDHKTFSTAIG
jgi:hypothetical protein